MAEWSARWTHNLAVPGSNPAMITCWILVCSKRSDSGERCEVKKAMKSRGGLAFIFSRSFLLRTAPHYLNAWNRLAGFVLGFPEFKSEATLVNNQPFSSFQLGFLILLCFV